MIYDDAQEHFRWIGIIADRIICAKNSENELPLLSLSFLDENHDLTKYSNLQRPSFPIKIEDLSNAKLYGIIVSAISSNQKSDSLEKQMDFDSILRDLSNEGYKPQKPCDSSCLNDGILEHHVNLCKSIEFLVVDRSLNVNMLTSDLRRLPRSFFVLKSDMQLDLLEDAVSLWLSKFHCNAIFDQEISMINNEDFKKNNLSEKNYKMQVDASNYAKVAACLARIFPKQINKNEIKKGINEEEIMNNKNLSKIILDELHAFVIEKIPTDEHLFMLFISDLFYATRSGAKKFVKLDQPPPLQKAHSLPQPYLQLKDAELNRPKTASALTMKKSLYPEKEAKITQSSITIKQAPTKPSQNQQKPKITKPKVEPKKEKEKIIPKKKEKNSQPPKNSKNTKSTPSSNKQVKPKPKSNKKEPSKEAKPSDLSSQNETIQKVDSNDSIEKLNEEEDSINNNQQENNIMEKPKRRKYILEFPEIEILLSRIIQKFPQNEIYYRKIFDIFMQVMQDATIINSPNISEIFTVSKAAFNQLLDGKEKLDFDFEQKIRSLLKKSNSNDEIKEETNENEKIQNSDINDSNKSSSIKNLMQNEPEENTTSNFNEENENQNLNDKIITDECENIEDARKDTCDIINEDSKSDLIYTKEDAANSASSSKTNDYIDNEDEGSNCELSYDKVNNENKNCIINNNDDENSNESVNFNQNISDDLNNKNDVYYDEKVSNSNNNNNDDDDDEIIDHLNNLYNHEKEASEVNNTNLVRNNKIDNKSNFTDNDSNSNNKNRVTFTLPANFNHKTLSKRTKNTFSHDFEDDEDKNEIQNYDFSFTSQDKFNHENELKEEEKEENDDEEEMTDEMILREAEKITSQKFNSKLKQLSSSSSSSSRKPKSTTLKKASTVPNHQTILNALRFNSLPSPKYKKLLDSITDLLKDFKDERILLLMASRTQKFKGIYVLSSEGNSADKLWGNGPNEIQNDDVNIFFKYINGQKSFEIIASKSFTQTTDGFSLKKQFESESW